MVWIRLLKSTGGLSQRVQAPAARRRRGPAAAAPASPPVPMGVRSTTVVGWSGQAPAPITASSTFWKRSRIWSGSFSGSARSADQRGGEQRRAVHLQQVLQHLVVRHAQADGLALRMAHAPRHFAGGVEDEGEGARGRRLQQPVLLVVHARVVGHLAQVAAQQREVVLVVDPADLAQPVGRGLVVQVAGDRVAGVRGHGDHAAAVEDGHRLLQQARLRVVGVQFEVLGHGVSRRRAPLAHRRARRRPRRDHAIMTMPAGEARSGTCENTSGRPASRRRSGCTGRA